MFSIFAIHKCDHSSLKKYHIKADWDTLQNLNEIPRSVSIAMAGPNLKRCLRDQADYKAVDALKSCLIGVSSHPFDVVSYNETVESVN